jgi:antitoxin component of MazEF toxin-antitoxin module
MEIETTTRKWGNSLGVRLPRDFVKKKNLKENVKIKISIITEEDINSLDEIFGMLKKRKISAQKMKDLTRKEEFEAERRKWKK